MEVAPLCMVLKMEYVVTSVTLTPLCSERLGELEHGINVALGWINTNFSLVIHMLCSPMFFATKTKAWDIYNQPRVAKYNLKNL
jgi:hypothetical protein